MEVNSSCASPKEEGELEDGEIFDDEPQTQRQQNVRPPRRTRTSRGMMNKRARLPGPMVKNNVIVPIRTNLPGPMIPTSPHTAFPPGLRPITGHGQAAPRSGFWERSHGALGRFRYRIHHASDWTRDWPERFSENHSGRTESPCRKQKAGGRCVVKWTVAPKVETVDESFEDLLLKYKQIQVELECIRKEERMALKDEDTHDQRSAGTNSDLPSVTIEETISAVTEQKKMFQAFNIKLLRQKLLSPAERDALNSRSAPEVQRQDNDEMKDTSQDDDVKDESEADLNISTVSEVFTVAHNKVKEEEDDLSELQLRLLALQSASRKWQQKEQQVLKESREKITKAVKVSQDKSSSPCDRNQMNSRTNTVVCRSQDRVRPAAKPAPDKTKPAAKAKKPAHMTKQAWRKQQLRTWKLQHQRQQVEQRHKQEEEEERKKREDEIRKIRDLSNQDEQYNRFMKLVGSKHRSRSKSSDADQRKLLKQSLDTSGNLYQYDNYDEVAMDTDSETNSPATSPTHDVFPVFPLESTPLRQGLEQHYLQQMEFVRSAPCPPLPPLPPPDEAEPPPKPPFADEEEEEEMLLREELLKSLANKRVVKAEDASSSSGPPSPALRPAVQPNTWNNLTAVSLNTVISHARALKFVRGHPAPKAPFVLPRHKTVVVCLNASDDSDSDGESCNPAQSVFGGLESMIKEARRTVEAAKPNHSVSEKNNPVKSAEALPDVKKVEYRWLREDMSSGEKQRLIVSSSPVDSDSELDIRGRAADLQEKFNQHKAQLSQDESLLKQLLQQEIKKKESLKAAEAKVIRLKEQMLASEKIVSANRVLLKKLQEQIQRVQHRVTVKQHQSEKLEKDLAQEKAATGPAAVKRSKSAAVYSAVKVRRLDYSDTHYAELITQKKRLQQLESEYALKIQKLKEAQALRQAEPRPTAPQTASTLYPLPQPSLHDLTQDKLTLSSEDVEAEDEEQQQQVPVAVTSSNRRRSFHESGSFTKPKLCHLDMPAALPVPVKHTKVSSYSTADLPTLLLGLNVQDLRQRYQHCAGLSVLLQEEMSSLCGVVDDRKHLGKVVQVDFEPMAAHQTRVEPKSEPLGPYHSPLLVFKSYRFSPYYRTKEKLSLRSVTYSNVIEPKKCFCRFDLTGTCNADDCPWQHMRNCTLTESQFFQDILSYSLPLIGCLETSCTSDISSATEKYMKKLLGANKDRMGTDQKAVLLVSKVNESLKHIPPFTTYKAPRRWRPEAQRVKTDDQEDDQATVDVTVPVRHDVGVQERWLSADICITQDDNRYFDSETDDISNLETSVLESPNDVQLWIKLAFKYLNQKDISMSECLDAALNTLSRALEDNREDAEVWCYYLTLFSRRGSREEVQEMCEMAVEHAPHYHVWWTYMSVEIGFEGKDYVCSRLIAHLLETQSHDVRSDVHSFQLLESVMFRVQLSVFTGRPHNALNILKSVLASGSVSRVADCLTVPDRCLMWLSYIYMTEFKRLPPCLYDPSNSNPSRIMCTDPFVIPWRTAQDIQTPTDVIIGLFEDAVSHCTDERLSSSEQIQASFPLHSNLIHLFQLLDRHQEAVALCERLLAVCPLYCPLLDLTSDLHASTGHTDKAIDVWMHAHLESSRDARIFYQLIKCLHTLGTSSVMKELFDKFMCSFCETVPDELTSLDVLRHILGILTRELMRAPTLKDHLQDEMRDQLPYLHLIHCFWESIYGGVRETIEAFEKALGTITKLELINTLWLDSYLSFTSSKVLGLQPSVRELKMFTGLVHRCLETVPSRLTLPFSSSQYWNCFSFHNKVISFYLGCFPQSQHSLVLERLQHIMPNNTELAIRLLQQEWQDGNVEHFKLQSRMLCSSIPTSLAIWKIAIAVRKEQRQKAEVQRFYQQALQKLPLSASLWKDCLLFEAAEGGKTDTLKKIIDKCQEVGVSLNEPLGLEPSQSE
ncbi:zinc finger C3H1 domain-containing protein isoform X1 [Xyrauchen texanus]|uniref:zinc finger C3H1 domain-containing protein isoform X1 n=1 Tax=Xyrauchen texanus TaxID=154827 RepID=UPI002241DF9C|nr:zinc finger C3H1 domain-containing protein isoform X1 [Xyrauchen texanus]